MERGYIKIWRRMLDSDVMKDDWLARLWLWCLLKASWKESRGVSRGQFVTTRARGSEELGVTGSRFYEGLLRLRDLDCITLESNNKATTITVCNYCTYQDGDDENDVSGNNEATTKQQRSNNLPLCIRNERREEGEEAPHTSLNSTSEIPVELLATEWVTANTFRKGLAEKIEAMEVFTEMIRFGKRHGRDIAKSIFLEIHNQDRLRSEYLSEFQRRVLGDVGLRNGSKVIDPEAEKKKTIEELQRRRLAQ